MNDHDLGLALQRDAELVGAPAPDLLDQLHRRRQHQRRQRTGLVAAVLGVVVVAGGIPLGQSLLEGPEGRTAFDPTISAPVTSAPAPVTSAPAPVTSAPAPVTRGPIPAPSSGAPRSTAAAPRSNAEASAASSSSPGAAAGSPGCPDAATLVALVPDRPTGVQLTDTWCSGTWAVVGLMGPAYGQSVELFQYADGAWRVADEDACSSGDLPADVQQSVCNAS